eukprot:TRINITY_DN867_c0_g1_i4.p2 TRINITY_DN867_c0_g1~~TRINITY_DN867_c0_g1_i4.p2  ORF type:complete len:369 (-),score=75.17 TRINITY_DN867_c0_g1_i4:1168-2274(-)
MIRWADPIKWVCETGRPETKISEDDVFTLDDEDCGISYYEEGFISCGLDHNLFVISAKDPDVGTFIIAVQSTLANKRKAMVFRNKGTYRFWIPAELMRERDIICFCYRKSFFENKFRRSKFPKMKYGLVNATPRIYEQLIDYDKSEVFHSHKTYKFGILYIAEGQGDNEQAIYSNQGGSQYYDEFLRTILGQEVQIDGWDKFLGGLSTETGDTSIYTNFRDREIMYHVATMLPFDEDDEECVDRKRHLGNDIVIIVFQEPGAKFDCDVFTTQFSQIYIVVEPVIDNNEIVACKIACANKAIVPPYSPFIPYPPTLPYGENLRNFIITKAINAERAAMRAYTFGEKNKRTRLILLEDFKTTWTKLKKKI